MSPAIPETHQRPPPPQEQSLPGSQEAMQPRPMDFDMARVPSEKLKDKVAVITGGDSGIGRSVALLFAREGADISLVYLNEHEDAQKTAQRIAHVERKAIQCAGDVAEPSFCRDVISKTLDAFGHIDILVNNAAQQSQISGVEDLHPDRIERIFRTNLFGCFYMTRAALPHLKDGSAIINTTSVQAYDPSPQLMDYACTKAAILNFTRSLAKELAPRGIRVNAVAPGPVWTPLIPASFPRERVMEFGSQTLFERPAQPVEIAPSYLYLAAQSDSSFVTGQVLHVNGGMGMFS